MATITLHKGKDGSITYRVRIRLKGMPLQSASFPTRPDAVKYAKLREAEMVTQRHFPQRREEHTLSELLERYAREVMPQKTLETQRSHMPVLMYWREKYGHKLLTALTKADIATAKAELTARGAKAATVCKYLTILSHALNLAMKEYDWLDYNVVKAISRPSLPPGKVRFLDDNAHRSLKFGGKSQIALSSGHG
jgi:hypothetical protein